MAKKVDLKAKAKRQKIMAAGGAVLLVGILAIQVPKTMKMLNAEAPPQPPPATAPVAAGTDPSVLPTPGTAVDNTGRRDERRLDGLGPRRRRRAPDNSLPSAGSRARTRSHSRSIRTRRRLRHPSPAASPARPFPPEPRVGSGCRLVVAERARQQRGHLGERRRGDGRDQGRVPEGRADLPAGLRDRDDGEGRDRGGALASGEATVTLRKGKATTLVNTADGTLRAEARRRRQLTTPLQEEPRAADISAVRLRARVSAEQGFGLVELLISMVMLNVAILALVAAFQSGRSRSSRRGRSRPPPRSPTSRWRSTAR